MPTDNYGQMPGRYPAIVRSYSQERRTCRIEIPGITDGSDVLPEAEIEYPIGDKSRTGANATEIEILPNDTVWIAFIGGDSRYPIITGYRNPQSGNSVDWRRFHHANIEITADGTMKLNAETLEINAANVIVTANTAIHGSLLTHNNVNVGSTHTHGGVQSGSSNTDVPE
ncbi:MAG: hypothetical protein K2Q13_10090 [Nitrosomonas sp.]|uniref:hypothetical protein n=1 Tax=Nitrosomonas sp. TaxID=42353 RepID=UPI0025EA5ECA|nr:hypothetical protein [Nitrosomonas sp.]MBY0475391.1 hypothetical protein [Nitrosomonas sp.]